MSKADFTWGNGTRKLKDLTPVEWNPRRLTKKQAQDIKESLLEFGLAQPIEINTDDTIIGGHQRVKILTKMWGKDAEVDVRIPSRLLTEDEAKRANIRFNKNTAEFDYEKLANFFEPEDLVDLGFTEDELGFSLAIDEVVGLVDDDDVPAEPEKIRSKPGDIWLLGEHRVLCGDSTGSKTMKDFVKGNVADIVITDPPYNVDYVGKTKDSLKIKNDKMKDDVFYEFLLDFYKNAKASSKHGSCIYVFHADSYGHLFRKAMMEAEYMVKQCLIWAKDTFVLGRQDYHWQHEPILYGWQEGAAHKWRGDRKQTTLLQCDRPKQSKEHPTMKPVELIDMLLQNSTIPGEIVLDPFGGSGSTLIACEKSGRICYTVEVDPKYVDVIVTRWQQFTGSKAKHEQSGELFDDRKAEEVSEE